jgi:hypothetical protein
MAAACCMPGLQECRAYVGRVQGVRVALLAAFTVGIGAFALTLVAALTGRSGIVRAQWAGYALMVCHPSYTSAICCACDTSCS